MANGAPTVSNGLVISGVTTSTTFSGSGASLTNLPAAQLTGALPAIDGSNLTNITSTTINNNGSNRIITGSSTANTLEGEATFTYDGVNKAKIDTSQTYATFQLDGNAGGAIEFYENGTRRFEIYGLDAEVALYDRDKGAYHTRFKSGGNLELSDGKLLIGTTSAGNSNADDLTVANSGEGGITIRSGSSSNGNIFFSDATSGAGEYAGIIDYKHSSNVMTFGTNGSERVRITSGGSVGINTSSPESNSGNASLHLHGSANDDCRIAFSTPTKSNPGSRIGYYGLSNRFGLDVYYGLEVRDVAASYATRFKIDNNGIVTMPNQPAFRAYISGGPQGINGTIPFSQIDYNIGSNYNSSNYRFTAPVAGRYSFHFYSIYRGNHTSNAFGFYINGGGFSGDRAHFTHSSLGGAWDYIDMSQVLNLGSGDYVTCLTHNAVDLHGGNWAAFSGHLVG